MIIAACPFRWATAFDDGPLGWRFPHGALHGLDVRPSLDQSAPSLFVFDRAEDVPKGATIITDDPEGVLSGDALAALSDVCGMGARSLSFDARRFDAVIFEAMTRKCCVTGEYGPGPLIPPHTGDRLELRFGPIRSEIAFDVADPDLSAAVLGRIRHDFKAVRQGRADDHPAKMLGAWCRKFKTGDYTLFQDQRDGVIEAKAPSTTISDSFNRSDDTDLNASSTGKSPSFNWTEVNGSWAIASNALSRIGDNAIGCVRAEYDLSSADHYAQYEVTTLNSGSGTRVLDAGCRIDASAHTGYSMIVFRSTGGGTVRLRRLAAGVENELSGAGSAVTLSIPDPIKVQADGTTIKGFFQGSEFFSVTNAVISGNTRCGSVDSFVPTGAGSGNTVLDDFLAEDLVTGGGFQAAWNALRSNRLSRISRVM